MLADHLRVQMADSVGIDLAHRSAARGQPPRIVVRLEIANQCCHARPACLQFPQRPLQKGGLARAGTGNQIQHQHAGGRVALAKARRQLVVLLEYSPPQLNYSGGHAVSSTLSISSISIDSISNSRP